MNSLQKVPRYEKIIYSYLCDNQLTQVTELSIICMKLYSSFSVKKISSEHKLPVDELQMLKALFDFEATLAKTLSFTEGELFYLQQTNTKQRNWWHVVNRKGQVGFVPSNYVVAVKVEPEFYLGFLTDSIESLSENNAMSQKHELVTRLSDKKKQIQLLVRPHRKQQAPKPPPRFDDTPPNGVSPSFDLRPVVSQQHINIEDENKKTVVKTSSNQLSSDTDNQDDSQDSSESIKPNAIYEIVQAVRKETQLSHEMSKVAVETVLISLREFLPGGAARSIIDALLREANSNITCPKNAIDAAPDALRMMTALNALSKAANDAQQRGWANHLEQDPVHIFDHEPAPAHAVLKLAIDLFSRKKTAEHFYTNDVKVAIDIIVRQLADLSPGDTVRTEPTCHPATRYVLNRLVTRRLDYGAHLHRRDDLLRCFARIFCEEGDASRDDQALVRAISNEFPHFFKA
ncbi:Transcription initiation factor TFIID subunit 5, partial [Operophtera brumata]